MHAYRACRRQHADYDLTSIQGGVWFDVTGTGIQQLVAWTQAGSAGWFSRFGS